MPSALGSAVFSMTANTAGLSAGFSKALAITTAGLAGIGTLVAMHAKRTQSGQHGTHQAREKAALASSQRAAMRDLGERQRIDKRMMMDTHKEELAKAKMAGINQINAAYLTNTHARALLGLTEAHRKDTLAMRESHIAAQAAMASEQDLSGGLSLVGVAATVTTLAIAAFAAAVSGMAMTTAAAATELDAMHNVEQTFGSHSNAIRAAVDQQAAAYGRARGEMLAYTEIVGRELQDLGISEMESARTATEVMQATSMLAASRRISAAEAFREVTKGEHVTEAQIRAYAYEHHYITVRNAALDQAAEKMARYELSAQQVITRTEGATEAGASWTNQINALSGSLTNLSSDIGQIFTPMMVNVIGAMAQWVQQFDALIRQARLLRYYLTGDKEGFKQELIAQNPQLQLATPEQLAIDARNEAANKETRRRQMIGQALGGGGGGGGGGYQGGIAGYARQVQSEAFNLKQMQIFQLQLTEAEKATIYLGTIAGMMAALNKPPAPAAPTPAPANP